MIVIAHRGASSAYPENTVEAFAGAQAQGADGVELDVRRTADANLAISHDDALEDGTVVVDTAFADLPGHITDLATVLELCASMAVINTEIKNWPDDRDFDPTEQLADAVVALIAQRGELHAGHHLISSFHLPTIDRVHERAPSLATAWLLGMIEDAGPLIDKTAARGHVAVHPHHAFVNADFVDRAHAAGLAVNTWTCDDPDRIRWLADLGVDAVVTNVPDIALRALGR